MMKWFLAILPLAMRGNGQSRAASAAATKLTEVVSLDPCQQLRSFDAHCLREAQQHG